MGTGASVPPSDAPELTQEEYIKEHHKLFEHYTKGEWEEAYQHVKTQSSHWALKYLSEPNYQNCIRISVTAIGKTQESPKDVDEAMEVLLRGAMNAKWNAGMAASLVGGHPRRDEVRKAVMKALAGELASASAEEQQKALLAEINEEARDLGFMVLEVARKLMAESKEPMALELVEKYLKLHKAPDPYDSGDLLALWYALQWRASGKTPKRMGKVAMVIFKSHHSKVILADDGEPVDQGVSSWDEKVLKEETVPEIMRDWRLYSDAMCFLTDGEVALEPMLVEACWDYIPKAFHPMWDGKYKRCLSHSDFGDKEFEDMLIAWEDSYKAERGGESDVLLFHLLFPSIRPGAKVDVCFGGIATNTIGKRWAKGRPYYMDEGLLWYHHDRVFWMFHETHHKYESEFQDQLDFAELIKKTDHPMFVKDNWMEEFKGGNESFPGEHWHGETEFDWYVQSVTRRLKDLTPSLGECWTSWWGGKEEEAQGAYHDFISEHHVMWDAFQKQDWDKVVEVHESQLRAMSEEKLGENNYRNVVNMSLAALVKSGQALDGPVLKALKTGLEVLEYGPERAAELMHHVPEQREELLMLLGTPDPAKAKRQPKKQKAISIVDDHHQMWDAYRTQEWKQVLEHVDLQVSSQARERLGEQNYQNCFRMAFQAMGHGLASPKDVDRAIALIKDTMESTGWELKDYEPLLSNHPKKFAVLQPLAPDDDQYHDFVTEHHAFWEASTKQDWEKVCALSASQLRPLCLARLGEQNYCNVVLISVQGLTASGKAVEEVVEALKKGLEVLGYPAERAKDFVGGIPEEKAAELLKLCA